jgi:hypothetical protein
MQANAFSRDDLSALLKMGEGLGLAIEDVPKDSGSVVRIARRPHAQAGVAGIRLCKSLRRMLQEFPLLAKKARSGASLS